MSLQHNDLPSADRKEESSSLKAKDIIVPAGMLVALSACGGGAVQLAAHRQGPLRRQLRRCRRQPTEESPSTR
jgi:hypothetical protein